ncbi:hypothetical protein SAMN04487910_2115 [Aquimarina amphilecti]|uniref:Outer membrane protein beta-barrel domain-containing protein n=1 Tax=Aquimarina amphilecti TaxID=1038014 RepID=A0A1H7NJV8_AQUAM|nr:hypothetical protein [Aquimarina amphilecti]SEL23609.1 hypothetical protein SAMN04487910_2115 [Aquimarina amphilecti]
MRKIIFSLVVLCTVANNGMAQEISLIGRLNGSIGFNYETIDYSGGNLAYSPGGGMGFEVGAEYSFFKGLSGYGTLGYQYNLAFQLQSGTEGSNKSSVTFSRTFFTFGINKFFKLSDNTLQGIVIGVGGNYNIPGKLKITENDFSADPIEYESNIGFHIDAKLRLKLSNALFLEPGIRYRQLELDAESFGSNTIAALPSHLRVLNTSGIEIAVSIVKKM